jgi:hypothetical protein
MFCMSCCRSTGFVRLEWVIWKLERVILMFDGRSVPTAPIEEIEQQLKADEAQYQMSSVEAGVCLSILEFMDLMKAELKHLETD